jgi:outer membrane protein OmpA-like peptidoglycan-associated protein
METQQQGTVKSGKRDRLRGLVVMSAVGTMLLAGATAVYWVRAETDHAAAAGETPATPVATAPEKTSQKNPDDVVHADIYFDFKSTRLSAVAVGVLQASAPKMTGTDRWVVLLQGQVDRQGPTEYNRSLAQRRAEAVKHFLVDLGVAEGAIKVVTIGPEGALCEESTKECLQLNRRVHIEMRRLAPAQS